MEPPLNRSDVLDPECGRIAPPGARVSAGCFDDSRGWEVGWGRGVFIEPRPPMLASQMASQSGRAMESEWGVHGPTVHDTALVARPAVRIIGRKYSWTMSGGERPGGVERTHVHGGGSACLRARSFPRPRHADRGVK